MSRTSYALVILASVLFTQSLLARVSLKVDSTVSRNVDSSPPRITVTISNIEDLAQGDEKYASRLIIYIEQIDQGDPIPIQNISTAEEIAGAPYIWIIEGDEKIENGQGQGGEQQHHVTIKLQLKKNMASAPNLSKTFDENNGKLDLFVDYDDKNTDITPTKWPLERSNAIAKEAPNNVKISGGHLSLIGRWGQKSSIAYTDGKTAAPGGVSMFVVEANQGNVVVGARVFNPNADNDKSTDCIINTNAEDGSACVTCSGSNEKNVYIDRGNLPSHVKHATVGPSSNSITIGGLEDEDSAGDPITYLAFLTYEPDGTKQSACYRASPRRNISWAELLDEDMEAKEINPRCFIATAAYGSSLHNKVDLLRWFRDNYLRQNWIGRKFIVLYYRYSPPAAEFIAERPWLRQIIRGALWFPTEAIAWLKGDAAID